MTNGRRPIRNQNDSKKKSNQITCKTCQITMNKSAYIQHLKENGGTCIGNRKPKDMHEVIDKIHSMGHHMDSESQIAGLEKKNGLNGRMGRNRFRR